MHINGHRNPAHGAAEHGSSKNENPDPQLLKRAVDSLGEIVLVFTPEGKILEGNRHVRKKTGHAGEEITQMHLTDLVPTEDFGFIRRQIEKVVEDGHGRFEVRLQGKEGLVTYDFTASLLRQNGKTLICAAGRNNSEPSTTRRKEASPYRRLFEDAQEGIAITTPAGEVVDANPAARQMLGYGPEDLPSLNVTDLYANLSELKKIAAELRREGQVSRRNVRFRTSGGEEIICEVSVTVWRGEGGEPEAFQTFFRDVTGRKRAEEAREESEEKFRKLAEGALVGIALIQDGTYAYVNPALSEITGYSREELLGTSPESIIHPEDWPQVQEQIERRIAGETAEGSYESRLQSKAGETRYVEVAGTRIRYQGEPAAIATIRDVTEQKQLQQEVLQVQEKERRRLGQDLHDGIASQLTGTTLLLDTLSTKAEQASASDTGFGEEEAERLRKAKTLVKESASEMRRLSRGLRPAGLPEGDLLSALEGLAHSFDSTAFETNYFEVERFEKHSASLSLDEEKATQLYRIAQEAVNNARQYAEEGEIAIRLQREDGTLALEVEDNGEGFEPSGLDRKNSLGLRSMRHRAELMGADLTIESSPGEGTLVRCRLPT